MEIFRKLSYLFHRRRFESDLDEEMRFHLEMTERAGGDSQQARKQFGNVGRLKESSREMWGWSSLERVGQDVRYALRQLARNPGFAAVAILSLGLGIGANTAIFSMIDHVMLRALPVSHPEELMTIRGTRSYPRFEQIRDRNEVFSAVMATHEMPEMEVVVNPAIGTGEEAPKTRAIGEMVSGNYFATLGIAAEIGRMIAPADDRAAESGPVAVLSDGYWKRMFGGTPDVLGRKIRVRSARSYGGTSGLDVYDTGPQAPADGALLTIVGVANSRFAGDKVGHPVDIWIPITMEPAVMPGRPFLKQKNAHWVEMMMRRKPGISEAQARASLTVTWRQVLADEEGNKITDARRREIAQSVPPLESGAGGFGRIRGELASPLLVLMSVVGMVLLIACLNVANLLLGRATARRREIGMRLSLGAGRFRLIRQLLTESMVLALAGGAAGMIVAVWASRLLILMISGFEQTFEVPLEMDWRTLGFTAAISLLTGLIFGLAPALRATRVPLVETLKDGARSSTAAKTILSKALVAAQVAVSMLLLVGAGLLLRTLYNLQSQDVGFNAQGMLILKVDPVSAGYRAEAVGRAMQSLVERLRTLPSVQSATFSENGLFSDSESGSDLTNIEGFTARTEEEGEARFDQIGPGYFSGIGVPILLGRELTERDVPGAPRAAVINQKMANFYFKGSIPIGKRFTADGVPLEVVGVARDLRDHGFREPIYRRFYVSYLNPIDGITTANFEIRARGNPGAAMAEVRNAVQSFNRNLSVIGLKQETELMDEDLVLERLLARLSGAFGVLAMLLAGIGLYGVMSFAVSRRTSEIGIRMALGAGASKMVGMIVGEVALLIGAGALLGLGAAFGLTRLLKSLLYGLTSVDSISYSAAIIVLAVAGLLAGFLPARRAAKIDPMIALRYE